MRRLLKCPPPNNEKGPASFQLVYIFSWHPAHPAAAKALYDFNPMRFEARPAPY
jgi:hypothetical protein